MQPKLIITFERLSAPNLLAKAGLIVTSMTANAHFPGPWPANVPSPEQLGAAVDVYEAAYQDAATGGTPKIAIRNAARAELTRLLKRLARYLEVLADGDVAMLSTTGFDLRRSTTRSAGDQTLEAPSEMKLSHGNRSGQLQIRIARLLGARSYQVQVAEGDPTIATNWKEGGTFGKASRMQVDGLTPGKLYSLRMCGIGKNGPGAWTPPSSIIAV